MDRVDDEVLVQRVASGDERALSGLYDRYAGLVYGTGMRYLRDRGTAEELVQDVFTSVWRSAAGFDPARAGFATWLDMTPAHPDIFAMPDPDSVIQLPWKPEVAWVAAVAILVMSAGAANFIPARRAIRVDPVTARERLEGAHGSVREALA